MALRNSYTLDGIPLTNIDAGYFPERSTGIRLVPSKRNLSISYPGVSGESFVPGASFTPGGVTVLMYVEGIDHQQFMERVEFLNGLFLQRHKLMELRHDYDEAGLFSRHAMVRCISSTEVKLLTMSSGLIEYILEVPGSFWRSTTDSIYTTPKLLTSDQTLQVITLDGGNAPVEDALIRVKGGFTGLTLKDLHSNSELTVTSVVSTTNYIIIDPKNWTARKVTSDTWTGGTNVDSSVISNRGMGSMFSLEPGILIDKLIYQIVASVDSPSGTPIIEIRAKKAYL